MWVSVECMCVGEWSACVWVSVEVHVCVGEWSACVQVCGGACVWVSGECMCVGKCGVHVCG